MSYRGFNNPLDCYRNTPKVNGLSRFELNQEDSGLYKALLRSGLLEEAIPQLKAIGRQLPDGVDAGEIRFQFLWNNKKIGKTAEILGISPITVAKYVEDLRDL